MKLKIRPLKLKSQLEVGQQQVNGLCIILGTFSGKIIKRMSGKNMIYVEIPCIHPTLIRVWRGTGISQGEELTLSKVFGGTDLSQGLRRYLHQPGSGEVLTLARVWGGTHLSQGLGRYCDPSKCSKQSSTEGCRILVGNVLLFYQISNEMN